MPYTLTEYLERAFYCRCGSVVFHNTINKVLQCKIKMRALADLSDCGEVPIPLRCCSYECYKLNEPYIM